MKRKIVAGALASLAFISQPVCADELARDGNAMLFAQLGDTISTHYDLALPNRYESDPLARPFVHSLATSCGVAVGVNLIARTIFRHSPKVLRYFGGVEVEYTGRNVWNMFRPHEVWGKR
jgi:hypothetical protein